MYPLIDFLQATRSHSALLHDHMEEEEEDYEEDDAFEVTQPKPVTPKKQLQPPTAVINGSKPNALSPVKSPQAKATTAAVPVKLSTNRTLKGEYSVKATSLIPFLHATACISHKCVCLFMHSAKSS